MPKRPIIAITTGDPCGIGPEIIIKALRAPEVTAACVPLVIGDRLTLERALCVASVVSRRKVRPGETIRMGGGRFSMVRI